MTLKHSFIYYGTFDDIGPALADAIIAESPTRVLDPFAGGCKLPYTLATQGIPVAVSDIHHYVEVSAKTILTPVEIPSISDCVAGDPGYMSEKGLGPFSKSVRYVIDGLVKRGDVALQAATARAMLHYARGWSGWETMVGRQKVDKVPVEQFLDDVNEALTLYRKRQTLVPLETLTRNVVDRGDGFEIASKWLSEGLIGPGTVVVTSPPGLWRSKQVATLINAEKNPFGFYAEVGEIIEQSETTVPSQLWRWDNEELVKSLWDGLQSMVRGCVEAGATVMVEKSTTHSPWPVIWDKCPRPSDQLDFPEKSVLAEIDGVKEHRYVYIWRP